MIPFRIPLAPWPSNVTSLMNSFLLKTKMGANPRSSTQSRRNLSNRYRHQTLQHNIYIQMPAHRNRRLISPIPLPPPTIRTGCLASLLLSLTIMLPLAMAAILTEHRFLEGLSTTPPQIC
jgi:hypothetical protein